MGDIITADYILHQKIVGEKNWVVTDEKNTVFFSKYHPKKWTFKDIRAQTVKYTANWQLVSEQKN